MEHTVGILKPTRHRTVPWNVLQSIGNRTEISQLIGHNAARSILHNHWWVI